MTIYLHGCSCGPIAGQLRMVKSYGRDNGLSVDIINTKYDKEAFRSHTNYLVENNLIEDSYPAIVVHNGNVLLLSQWQS